MKIANYEFPDSSFLSIEKDLEVLTDQIFKNTRLQRLLYYTTPDALNRPNLTEDEVYELFSNNIKTTPQLLIDGSVLNYIIISFDNFIPNATNPEFRDNVIIFDIVCHFDQWKLKDSFQLRPYKIAAEIDTILHHQRLTGIGETEFLGASQLAVNQEFAGVTLMYKIIHGDEDKYGQLNPANDENFEKEFDQIFNS